MRAILVVMVLTGCGVEIGEPPSTVEDGKQDGPGGSTALTATAFLTKIGVQYCDECFRCRGTYPDGSTAFRQDFGATTSECYAGTSAYYAPGLVEQSIAAGRVTYNAMAAKSCLAGVVYQQSCGSFWQNPPQFPDVCDQALVGKIPDGGSCVSVFDCANVNSECDDTTKKCTR